MKSAIAQYENQKRDDSFRAKFERFQAARRSARAKVSEVLGRERSELSKRALLQRQRAARKAIAEALAKTHGASGHGRSRFTCHSALRKRSSL